MTRRAAHNVLKTAFIQAGLNGHLATHSLRKSFAQRLYEQTGDIFAVQVPLRDGKSGRLAFVFGYCSRCQRTKSSIARMPSVFTGTALDTSPPLTIDLSYSKSLTGFSFCHTSPIWRLSNSLMRPPVETPSMKSPRFRTS